MSSHNEKITSSPNTSEWDQVMQNIEPLKQPSKTQGTELPKQPGETTRNIEPLKQPGRTEIAKLAIDALKRWTKTIFQPKNNTANTPIPTGNSTELNEKSQPRLTMNETLRLLNAEELEQMGEARPKYEVICDRSHIEDQKIDVINKSDLGKIEFRFKLRTSKDEMPRILKQLIQLAPEDGQQDKLTPNGATVKRGQIIYKATKSEDWYPLCDAIVFEKDGIKVSIADPTMREGENLDIADYKKNGERIVRSAIGLVTIETPIDEDPDTTEQTLKKIFEQDLEIPNALEEVPEDAEAEYKQARYKWQHALDGELSKKEQMRAEQLQREEVFPGYSTYVEKGKRKEYLKRYGRDLREVHHLASYNAKSIYQVLTQGLMSTTERYSRGIIKNGLSSRTDIDTGGADNVFTRIADKYSRDNMTGGVVVFKPELFDRTDWYAYDVDNFGATDKESFAKRISPDALFTLITDASRSFPYGNEQMFRTGIGANYIEVIEVGELAHAGIVADLKKMGLTEFDGKPIEEVIRARKKS